MWARGISIDDLSAAIKNGTSYTGAGQFDAGSGTTLLRPQGQLDSAQAYSNLIVGSTHGAPVYLRDVATVSDSVQDERLNMRFWARGYPVPGATVVLAVYRQAGANAVEVANSIRDLLPHDQRRVAGLGAHHAALRPLARASSTRSTTSRKRWSSHSSWS